MEEHKSGPTPWEGGGVLLPLFYRSEEKKEGTGGEFVFLLNKRSKNLPQGGDLCAPGGGDHPVMDSNAQKILDSGIFPSLQSPALRMAKERRGDGYQTILYYWGNALRESWEEIRLSTFNVDFLGPSAHLPAAVPPLDHFSSGRASAREMDLPAESGSRKNRADSLGRLLSPGELRRLFAGNPRGNGREGHSESLGVPLPHRGGGRRGRDPLGRNLSNHPDIFENRISFPAPAPRWAKSHPSSPPANLSLREIPLLAFPFSRAVLASLFGVGDDDKTI